jgi:uncharacterized protein
MPRPRRFRKILEEPQTRCFKPENDNSKGIDTIKINIDEFEALRLRDYHDIQQKRSADIMDISQPTFHRVLASARKKVSKALIEGSAIIIVGEDYITDKKRYKCKTCGFEWLTPEKEYDKCPDCQSQDIIMELDDEDFKENQLLLQRRSYGGPGLRVGPPRVCKCPECGYESPKTRTVPCKNIICPKCETPLCGAD